MFCARRPVERQRLFPALRGKNAPLQPKEQKETSPWKERRMVHGGRGTLVPSVVRLSVCSQQLTGLRVRLDTSSTNGRPHVAKAFAMDVLHPKPFTAHFKHNFGERDWKKGKEGCKPSCPKVNHLHLCPYEQIVPGNISIHIYILTLRMGKYNPWSVDLFLLCNYQTGTKLRNWSLQWKCRLSSQLPSKGFLVLWESSCTGNLIDNLHSVKLTDSQRCLKSIEPRSRPLPNTEFKFTRHVLWGQCDGGWPNFFQCQTHWFRHHFTNKTYHKHMNSWSFNSK